MCGSSRFVLFIAVGVLLAAAIALVPDPTTSEEASPADWPNFEATPLPELAGGSRATGGAGNLQKGL